MAKCFLQVTVDKVKAACGMEQLVVKVEAVI